VSFLRRGRWSGSGGLMSCWERWKSLLADEARAKEIARGLGNWRWRSAESSIELRKW